MPAEACSALLSPTDPRSFRSLRAEEVNARNYAERGAHGLSIPWDLHPRSLHAEFAHNTDLFFTHDGGGANGGDSGRTNGGANGGASVRSGGGETGSVEIVSLGEVGVWAHSEYGLGGGLCRDVLRDGTEAEMVRH